jgi:hypothetical protein
VLHESDDPREFLLKSGNEIMRAILEKHDETERKENEEGQPKEPADQRHRLDRRAKEVPGQSGAISRQSSD